MKKLLIMCICGLMIIMCACGKKSDNDTEIGKNEKEDAQENEISQEETINDWNEALGVTAEDDKDTEDKVDGTSSSSSNNTTNSTTDATTNTTTNTTTNNGGNDSNVDGGTESNDTEDTTETDEKEEGDDEKEDDSDAWTKDY